jgi:hypothetical protein
MSRKILLSLHHVIARSEVEEILGECDEAISLIHHKLLRIASPDKIGIAMTFFNSSHYDVNEQSFLGDTFIYL